MLHRHPVLRRLLLWSPATIFVCTCGFPLGRIDGRSMQPSLNPNSNQLCRDIVFLNPWKPFSGFKRGDVVNLRSPYNPHVLLTKRIIGVGGDTVVPLHTKDAQPRFIPRGYCWVEGDESFHSQDSNQFGPVPLGLVQSQILFVLWPLSNFGPVSSKLPAWKLQRVR